MSANNTQNKSIWRNATQWLKDFALYLGAATATLTAIAAYQKELSTLFQAHLNLGLL